ncbi:hypothetical protein FC83_GL002751 [Agrilactobacillus composti DSM 18527 = JCM 14202]|uniref:Uncharacterized protein n=1 Tax=Agrilactobacillus composti DSM 18527 = JCM 14202 TaxID=1423734 RepID=A0A0R1XTB7_9LACO|nr:hypothetical protein FC83_GL002751 [Agrilactobacillus composti DSM 18527 = JCM 14202]
MILVSLISIVLDLIALGAYYLQLQIPTLSLRVMGIFFQALIVIITLVLVITYKGRRFGRFYDYDGHARPFTIRFAIIFVSFLINGLVLVLYIFSITGRNTLIFSGS